MSLLNKTQNKTRRLVKQGSNAFTVTLPITWIRDNNLKPGDMLNLKIYVNRIQIDTSSESYVDKIGKVSFSDKDIIRVHPYRFINRIFSAMFKAGFDEIIIESGNRDILDYLINKSENFIGLEMIEDKGERIIFRSIVNLRQDDFLRLYIRAFGIIKTMAQNLLDCDNHYEIIHLEKTNNKLTDYLKRLLSAKVWDKIDKYYYCIITDNERLADEFKYLAIALKELPLQKKKQYMKEFTEINEMIGLLFAQINKDSKENLKRISEIRSEYSEKKKNPTLIDYHIRNIHFQIYELIESILELRFFNERST
jgi:phosphate uptake regulator